MTAAPADRAKPASWNQEAATGATSGIPAAALFPSAFGGSKPDWVFSPKDIPEEQSRKFFLASEIHAGWRYYTDKKDCRLFKEYPDNYEADIGYKYKHGPGKTNDKGEPMEERAKPQSIWLCRAWLVEEEKMVAFVIDSYNVQQQMHQAAQHEEFLMLDSGISNFYFDIRHHAKPASPQYTYTTQAFQRVLRHPRAYAEAQQPWWPDSFWQGLNPLTEPAQPLGENALPATTRDFNGAEQDMTVPQQGAYNW